MDHTVDCAKQEDHCRAWRPPSRRTPEAEPPLHPLLHLQRQAGNQAIVGLLQSGKARAKLEVSNPDDPAEREADDIANRVLRAGDVVAPANGSARREADAGGGTFGNFSGEGEPLSRSLRSFYEPRLDSDLGHVRVHTDTRAAEAAAAVNALAFTEGRDVVFGPNQFAPETPSGARLLAHELAHVVHHSARAPDVIHRQVSGAQCTGVRITLPNTIVFEGNKGTVSASVKTSLPPTETPYTIEYNPAEGQFVIKPGENVVLLDVSLTNKPQSELDLYIAYRDSLTSKQVGLEVFSTSARVIAGGSMDPRHARGYAGEQGMGFGYKQEQGWIFVEGPSGAAGHGITTPGFDGVAYNTKADELHVIDNKSLKAETARSATALTRNLLKNLDGLIEKVEGMQDMPSRIRILQLLKQMRASVAGGKPLPANTKLVVTGVGGRSTGVSRSLEELGVEFREPGVADVPLAPTPQEPTATPETTTAPETTVTPEGATGEGVKPLAETPEELTPAPGGEPGVAGGLFGFFLPLIAGFIHQRAVERRIEEQAHKEGYAPRGAPSGEGFLYDLGAWFLDPGNEADKAVSLDKRFDLAVWRQHLREVANGKQPGDTLKMQWDVGRCAFDFFGHQEVDTKYVTYKKQADGRWKVESGDASGTPDLNDILSTAVPDEKIKSIVYQDPCSS